MTEPMEHIPGLLASTNARIAALEAKASERERENGSLRDELREKTRRVEALELELAQEQYASEVVNGCRMESDAALTEARKRVEELERELVIVRPPTPPGANGVSRWCPYHGDPPMECLCNLPEMTAEEEIKVWRDWYAQACEPRDEPPVPEAAPSLSEPPPGWVREAHDPARCFRTSLPSRSWVLIEDAWKLHDDAAPERSRDEQEWCARADEYLAECFGPTAVPTTNSNAGGGEQRPSNDSTEALSTAAPAPAEEAPAELVAGDGWEHVARVCHSEVADLRERQAHQHRLDLASAYGMDDSEPHPSSLRVAWEQVRSIRDALRAAGVSPDADGVRELDSLANMRCSNCAKNEQRNAPAPNVARALELLRMGEAECDLQSSWKLGCCLLREAVNKARAALTGESEGA